MVKIKYNFNKMNGALKEAGAELNFKYKFNNPNFYKIYGYIVFTLFSL